MILDRKISVDEAVLLLGKDGIMVSRSEAHIILDFLYLMAKNNAISNDAEKSIIPKEKSNSSKWR
ncbi:hypothetical protein QFZ20_000326 [Flavobacterium sp. W4I14]|nr:hypothetical protein [Flavobacterium sp. W4I14]